MPEDANTYPQPLVSVVMPVFNQERALRLTLDSIRSQTLRNFELVLVDDGSTDGSLAIEGEFEGRDPRIQLFQRAREGAAPARNFGLGASAGRYVIFLDSDDLFHPDLLLNMASALEATGADICVCEADSFCEDVSAVKPHCRLDGYDEGLYRQHAFGRTTFQVGGSAAWNKMYRREFLIGEGILFYDTKCDNDRFFVYKAMWKAESVYLLKEPLVHYRRGLGTSIQDARYEHPLEAIRVVEKVFSDIFEPDAFSEPEAASLRLACTDLLLTSAKVLIARDRYAEQAHELATATMRRWSLPGVPRSRPELKCALRVALMKYATFDKVVWASERWAKKAGDHTLPENIGFALRIAIAMILSRMPIAR